MIGQRLGSYEITAKLGEGGMGEVYRATDTRLKREVAIKVLPAAFTEDRERLARFEREAQLLAQLNHTNIAQIYGIETSGTTHALVMELVPGPTLAERLESGPLSLAESLSFALQIAQALEEAHEKGIVHRDLKPQNIKASSEGRAKVLDFGLAKAMESGASASSAAEMARSPTIMNSPTLTAAPGTQLGVILGTAAYMAPEQARGAAVDKRADIWAFGVVFFEMLTRRRLFEGESVSDTLAAVLRQEVDFSQLPRATPAAIRRLLRRCLERNPKNRLRDIGDARLMIEETLRDGDAAGADPSGGAVAGAPGAGRHGPAVWTAAAILAAGTLGVGFLLSRAFSGTPAPPRFEKLTYAPQFISQARFAADGQTVVFSAARDGNTSQLFVRQPGDPQPRALGKADFQLLSVSSKGELALLTRARYQGHNIYLGTLARMPLAEASPRELLNDVTSADWSPDGAELAVIRRVGGMSRLEYPIGKVLAESTGYLSDIRVSPRGDRIAFMRHNFAGDNRGPVVVVDRAGAEVASSPEYWGEQGLAWSEDAEEVLFSSLDPVEGDEHELRALGMNGKVRKVLAVPTGLIVHDRARDGRLLVATYVERGAVLARLSGADEEREIPWLDRSFQPVVSRDGRSLLFQDSSAISGRFYSVLFLAAEDSPPVRLGDGGGTDISADGSAALAVVMDDPPRLMLYPTGAGESRDLSAPGFVTYESYAQFLADGTGVVYCGNAAGQASRCFLRDLASGTVRAVTPEGTSRGSVSPDGTAVVARGADGRYRSFAVGGGKGVPVPGMGEGDEVLRWSADGRALLVMRRTEVPARVDRLDLVTGERTLVRLLAPADRAGLVSVEEASFSADETAYAYGLKRKVGHLFAVEGVR